MKIDTPAPGDRWTGWTRPRPTARWVRRCSGPTYHATWNLLLLRVACPRGGDRVVVRLGDDPNMHDQSQRRSHP